MTNKTKILLVTDEMEVGGTQRQIVNLLTNIDRSIFDVELVYFINRSYLVDELELKGVTVTQIKKTKKLDYEFVLSLTNFIKKNKFDLVHAFALSAEFWVMVSLIFNTKTKLCSSVRGVYEWYGSRHWIVKSIISIRSKLIISNSMSGANYLKNKIWPKRNNICVIHNGIELKSSVNKHYNFNNKRLCCLVLGRLIEGKNIRLLIDAVKAMKNDDIHLTVNIAGDGPDKQALIEYSADIKDATINFLGEVDNVAELISKSDLLVQPSLREGLSNSILEAMYCGLPVLASDADGNMELIKDMETGLLFSNNNLESLITKLTYMKHNYDSAVEIALNAKKWVKSEFSIKHMCGQYEKKYMEVVNGK